MCAREKEDSLEHDGRYLGTDAAVSIPKPKELRRGRHAPSLCAILHAPDGLELATNVGSTPSPGVSAPLILIYWTSE